MVIGSRLCLLVVGATLVAGSAFAQASNQATPDTMPNLSKQLNQSNGVIHPKEVDPTIEKPAPKTGDPNAVPPPGTSGGAPAPQAK
jgi:protein-disulfide isomerase